MKIRQSAALQKMGRLLSNEKDAFHKLSTMVQPSFSARKSSNAPPPTPAVANGGAGAWRSLSSSAEKGGDDGLPHQPVPTLSTTILNFLAFNHVFAKKRHRSQQEVERIVEAYNVCHDLANDEKAHNLQRLLEKRAEQLPNWLTPWWLNVAYLEARTPLPIVTSPGIMLPDFKGFSHDRDGQVEVATKLVHASLKFLQWVVRGELKTDRTGAGEPLDMSQYAKLYGSVRVPRRNRDEIRYGKDLAVRARHIIVMRNGHSFYFPVLSEEDEPLPAEQLRRQFAEVFAQSEAENWEAVNLCSADERNEWADVYARLEKTDAKSIETVERALFVLALDKSISDPKFSKSSQKLRQSLHGGGTRQNTRNRWFDKTIQFSINDNCEAFGTYEHTPAEGPPLAALLDYVVEFVSTGQTFESANSTPPTTADDERVERLKFTLDDEIRAAIQKASRNVEIAIDNLEVLYYKFDYFGKNVPKSAKVSPDSFVQIAMQLAYYRLHHGHPPTYETATLRKFVEGRTETLRLPNDASVAFVEAAAAVDGVAQKTAELKALLLDAILAHKNYSALAMNGQGMDRHLLGLRLMAAECGEAAPAIFASGAYEHLTHFRLSTSQVPTRSEMAMCFGPSAADCYGVCYNPQERSIGFTISAYNNCAETSGVKFAAELETALLDLRAIFSGKASKIQSNI